MSTTILGTLVYSTPMKVKLCPGKGEYERHVVQLEDLSEVSKHHRDKSYYSPSESDNKENDLDFFLFSIENISSVVFHTRSVCTSFKMKPSISVASV